MEKPATVTVKQNESTDPLEVTYADGTKVQVFAKVEGWQLFNLAAKSTLMKDIEGFNGSSLAWTGWNNASLYRSFWSVVPTDLQLTGETLSWQQMASNVPTDDSKNPAVYPMENTLADVTDSDGTTVDNHTNVALAVTLTDANGKALSLAKWLSKYYTLDQLKEVLASYWSNTLFSYADGAWSSITKESIDFILQDDHYNVKPTVKGTTWYAKNATTAYTTAELQALIAEVPLAQIWNNGHCYYFTEIKHSDLNASAAIVRNHWYSLKVNTIAGLGTPVYDEQQVVDPVRPTENTDQWYLSAEMHVQAWRLLTQELDFVTTSK